MCPETLLCPQCAREPLPGARFCCYCGAAIPQEEAASTPPPVERALPVPDSADLSEPCTVIYAGAGEMQVQRIGRLVAEAIRQPLPDVTRNLRTSKGILATGMPPEKAVELVSKIGREIEENILVIPDSECVPALQPMRMRHITFNNDGFECEAYSWDETEKVHVTWNQVFLVSCGRLELDELMEKTDEANEWPVFSRRPGPSLTSITRHEFLLDVILFDPPGTTANGWRNLRLDQNTAAFALTELHQDRAVKVGPIFRSAMKLEPMSGVIPMNQGVSLLAAGAAGAAWEPLTFLNKRDFESYTYWLTQLVRYGRPIPA